MKTVLASVVLLAVATGVLAQGALMLLDGEPEGEPAGAPAAAQAVESAPAAPSGDVRVVYPAPWRDGGGGAVVAPPPDTSALRAALDRRSEGTRYVKTIPVGPSGVPAVAAPQPTVASRVPPAAPLPPPPPGSDVQVLAKEFDAPPVPTPRAPPAARSDLVDLNTASLAQLDRLGAGKIGRAIVRGRPYGDPEDLVDKRVLRRSTFERIRDKVAVR